MFFLEESGGVVENIIKVGNVADGHPEDLDLGELLVRRQRRQQLPQRAECRVECLHPQPLPCKSVRSESISRLMKFTSKIGQNDLSLPTYDHFPGCVCATVLDARSVQPPLLLPCQLSRRRRRTRVRLRCCRRGRRESSRLRGGYGGRRRQLWMRSTSSVSDGINRISLTLVKQDFFTGKEYFV